MSAGPSASELLKTFATLFGALGNRSLSLDPRSAARLTALEGKSVRFDVIGPTGDLTTPLTLEIIDAQIAFDTRTDSTPDAIVRGTAPALFGWLVTNSGHRAPAGVTFEGDENLLQQIAALVKDFRPDLEAPLDQLFGRAAARDLLGAAETTANLLRSAFEGLGHAMQTSARTAVRAGFVAQPDMPDMLDALHALQLRMDRLGARIQQLELQATSRSQPE